MGKGDFAGSIADKHPPANAGGPASIPDQGTRSYILQLTVDDFMCHN